MRLSRTTYRTALIAAALSCFGYAAAAQADHDGRDGRRWDDRGRDEHRWDDRRPDRGDHGHWGHGRWDEDRGWREREWWEEHRRHWAPGYRYPPGRGYYAPWYAPRPWYYRPDPGYGYYRPWPGYYAPSPRYDDGDVSLTIRIPF